MTCKTQKDVLFSDVKVGMAPQIVEQVVLPVLNGSKIERPGGELEEHSLDLEEPFFTMQHRVVLENNGRTDPEKLDDYLAHGGYQGLKKALGMSAEDICKQMLAAGLRGRGGAGFPTGIEVGFRPQE
jgi:hypothetical protein